MGITKTIADLRQQVHDDLRKQHPEWVLPNGESPMCDAYEARLMGELSDLGVRLTDDDRPNGSTIGNQAKRLLRFGFTVRRERRAK